MINLKPMMDGFDIALQVTITGMWKMGNGSVRIGQVDFPCAPWRRLQYLEEHALYISEYEAHQLATAEIAKDANQD